MRQIFLAAAILAAPSYANAYCKNDVPVSSLTYSELQACKDERQMWRDLATASGPQEQPSWVKPYYDAYFANLWPNGMPEDFSAKPKTFHRHASDPAETPIGGSAREIPLR